MSAAELVAKARAAGGEIYLRDGEPKMRCNPSRFPDDLLSELRSHREELRAYLASQPAGVTTLCPVAGCGRPSVDDAPCFIHRGEGTPRATSAPKSPILPPAICLDCHEPIPGSFARCSPCAGEVVDRWLRSQKGGVTP